MSTSSGKAGPAGSRPVIASDSPHQAALRRQWARCLVATALCGAGWYVGVRPIEARLADQQTKVAQAEARIQAASAQRAQHEQAAERLGEYDSYIEGVRGWTAASSDSAQLYQALTSLASEIGVRVESIDPGSSGIVQASADEASPARPTRTRRSRPAAAEPKGPKIEGVLWSYRLSVRGRYALVAEFIAACEHELGATRIAGLRIVPAQDAADPDEVQAMIETEHLSLRGLEADPPRPAEDSAASRTRANAGEGGAP